MSAEPMTPAQWLARQPLLPQERLYLVLGCTSAANPLTTLRSAGNGCSSLPIWKDTPYASWSAVMPYVTELSVDSPVLEWIATTDALDWGWLAVSADACEQVVAHLCGLTQVRVPKGNPVFFRFWDGRQLLPTLDFLGSKAGELLPGFKRFLINAQARDIEVPTARAPLPYPWWEVPSPLLQQLAEQDPQPLIDNAVQWLGEEQPFVHDALPLTHLRHKIARFLERSTPSDTRHSALVAFLAKELGQ